MTRCLQFDPITVDMDKLTAARLGAENALDDALANYKAAGDRLEAAEQAHQQVVGMIEIIADYEIDWS